MSGGAKPCCSQATCFAVLTLAQCGGCIRTQHTQVCLIVVENIAQHHRVEDREVVVVDLLYSHVHILSPSLCPLLNDYRMKTCPFLLVVLGMPCLEHFQQDADLL
mmetsp:Transcript_43575/g.86468  ORF Transcript_43575/g.86468 Transcript_43575/m.86468 type:complete len:105 (-) Transcript_43575:1596-1910(-)